jgi:hypothetical protein
MTPDAMASDGESVAVERRIELFLVAVGAAVALGAAVGWGWRAGAGAAIGAALCWLNYRWLRQGATAVIRLGLAQAGAADPRVPRRVHAKFFGRLVLLVLVVYVILARIHLPVVAVLCGLTAVLPAILIELGYEIMHGRHRWNAP